MMKDREKEREKEKEKEKEKQRPQGNTQRSKSIQGINSKVSQTNSLRSQVLVSKLPCESHFFQMKPISGNYDTYYQQKIHFYFTHEMKESRPFPILLRQFKDVEYLPIFGNETQIEGFRKHKNKYRCSFYEEKSKASIDQPTKKDLTTPVPKHKYCQICKMEFQAYQKHIYENLHLKNLRGSYGNDVIDQFIEDYIEARQTDKEPDEVAFLKRLVATLKQSSQLLKSELINYSQELHSYKKTGRK